MAIMAVSPVLPPSAIPAPGSTDAVARVLPNKEPKEIAIASQQYVTVDRGKCPVSGSTTPQKRAMEYKVPQRYVRRARTNCRPEVEISQSCVTRCAQ